MNLTIKIEDNYGGQTNLRPDEIAELYYTLSTLLDLPVQKCASLGNPLVNARLEPLGGNGYLEPDPNPNARIHYWYCEMDTNHGGECRNRFGGIPANDRGSGISGGSPAFNAEAKAEESPETLREPECWQGEDKCRCNKGPQI